MHALALLFVDNRNRGYALVRFSKKVSRSVNQISQLWSGPRQGSMGAAVRGERR